jgi:hypothetical protein
MVGGMATSPSEALDQLRREARDGSLARFCGAAGIDLLVAFGSATDPGWPVPPRDLDLAVIMSGTRNLLQVLNAVVVHLGFEQVDLMDLARAGEVARVQALGRGELLHEETPGTFAEQQILAFVQHADTRWMRDLQLQALAR